MITKNRNNNKNNRRNNGQDREFESRLVEIKRVTRVVAGGKRLSFRAAIVVGDQKGKVGFGVAKGKDVAQAISKATNRAKKAMIEAPIVDETIPQEIKSKYGAAVVLLKPARVGRGLVAGSIVRVICELAGIKNVVAKIISKSTNKINNGRATIKALSSLPK